MSNVTPFALRVDASDILTTSEMARLLRCGVATVRSLTEREWHPLPSINRGMAHKKQRIFLRPSVLRWLEEEEKLSKPPARSAEPKRRIQAG